MSSFISPDYPDFLLRSLPLFTTMFKVPKVEWHVALLTPGGERSEVSVKPKLSFLSESQRRIRSDTPTCVVIDAIVTV